ncbi:hypothetical protein HDU90_001326 [Geranomyces variabilis]|nr:hypothetical protein HDU90_001326 [Geranomyces variabilis]
MNELVSLLVHEFFLPAEYERKTEAWKRKLWDKIKLANELVYAIQILRVEVRVIEDVIPGRFPRNILM